MDSQIIVSNMNTYLHSAAKVLADWLSKQLPLTGEAWWDECVIGNLSVKQRELAEENDYSQLTDFDLAALLRIADRSWYNLCGVMYLPPRERECLRSLIGVRNNWAHCSVELPNKDTILSDLDKLSAFFTQYGYETKAQKIDAFKNEVARPGETSEIASPESAISSQAENVTSSEIHERDLVRIVSSPNTRGMVFQVSKLGSTTKYEVFVDGQLKTFYDDQIAPVEAAPQYNWISTDELRCYLSAFEINHPSSSNLYSLNSARIDFVPYQFRPALKLIKSDEPRILIADSVGVGKTIEAGLIIKELQARQNVENILIICPKPLVADRKWENEMKRFDEDFLALDGEGFRQLLLETDRDGDWPSRYNKVILPYSILDSRAYEGEERRRGKMPGLIDLDPAPHFDLVIIDEAHHLRNGSMEKEKAFAYKCTRYFCEHADAVVMLTATPLQTSDNDLYTLLNLLRPDIVIDSTSFQMMARPNSFITKAAHLVRQAKANWKEATIGSLQDVLTTQWGENVIAQNPVYRKVLAALEKETLTREERVQMISDIESLHSFDPIINRTRRKDIQDFCIRRTYTLESEFTEEQRLLHDSLLTFEAAALTKLHGGKGVKFMMSTIRRQAASCIFGLAPHIRNLIDRRFDQLSEDPDVEFDSGSLNDFDFSSFRNMAQSILEMADSLPDEDPKFESLLTVLKEKQTSENNKVILFSTFRCTLAYVHRKLKENGFRVAQIDGSVDNETRLDLRARFELPKESEDAIDILLFTEVGSEGLDYQFCDMMVNYDLPWNPMRIEQRIGRIDRRGQKSETVSIFNVITTDTIDADIYTRCLLRIGIFENSIGECEEILGEIGRQIEQIAMDTGLTDEERRWKLEQMADNEIRKAQELNRLESEEKELFGFDLSNYVISREIRDAESPFLSINSLLYLTDSYLQKRLGEGNYLLGGGDLKTLRLNLNARAILLEDYRSMRLPRNSLNRKWELYLKGNDSTHPITFTSETAEKNRNAFFVTPVHPLLKQAARYFKTEDQVCIHLEYFSDEVPKGDYAMAIYAWDYIGLRSNFRLIPICENPVLESMITENILTSSGAKNSETPRTMNWNALEELQVNALMKERARHLEATRQFANYKLTSLRNNFNNRRIVLERIISEAESPKLINMHTAELANARERFELKTAEIMAQIENADIHSTLIANGIISVR